MTAALVLVTSVGCSSIPDITFADVDGGAVGEGGPCTAIGPEICGDGLDNDCNGSADCADPTCSATYSCVDGVPSDWKVIAFAESSRAPCPAGFGESTAVRTVAGASGQGDCTCDCGAAGNCGSGKVTLAFGTDATCAGSTQSISAASGCDKHNGAASFNVGANTFVKATPPAAPACVGAPKSSLAPLVDGRTCALAATGGCSGSSSCAPNVTGAYAICVQKAGANACPAAFPKGRRGGTTATDTRACSACTCAASPCSVDIKLHDSMNCGSTKATFKTSAACTKITNAAFSARGSEATATGGCTVATPPQQTGALTFVGESTICCK